MDSKKKVLKQNNTKKDAQTQLNSFDSFHKPEIRKTHKNDQLPCLNSPTNPISVFTGILPFYLESFNPFLRYIQFQNLVTWVATSIFNHTHPKIIETTLSFPEFVILSIHFLNTAMFGVLWPQWPHAFPNTPTQTILNQL